jgi:actin-related protein 5
MSELLFETYQIPSVCYGVDSLFSYHETHHDLPPDQQTSLVISSSHSSTTIIPILSGVPHIAQSRRLNWGGLQESEFLLRLMQVKYSTFPSRMTSFQAFDLVQDHCLFSAEDFQDDIRKFSDPDFLAEANRVIQFPFSTVVSIRTLIFLH